MAGFQFTNTKLTLDIAGRKFEVQATARLTQRIAKCGEALAAFAQGMKGKGGEIDLDAAEKLLREQIDSLLGGGASAGIFEGREPDYYDTLEVWSFIVDTVQASEAKRPALAALKKLAK